MTNLFLIAHKVRGEVAFDVATQVECGLCHGTLEYTTGAAWHNCVECDHTGFWWIIPTSGHRAYPASVICMDELQHMDQDVMRMPLPTMDSLPDHYPTRATAAPTLDVSALIPQKPIHRRF